MRTDADGTPNDRGKYETKKVIGITYSHHPVQSTSAKADAAIMRFLLWTAAAGAIAAIAGMLCGVLCKWKQIPLPFWDELLVAGAIICGVALLGVFLYPMLKWILLGGAGCFGAYRAYKGLRKRKVAPPAPPPENTGITPPDNIAR